jgi:acetyl/propionyl-CoA carboxylase alpha subunit
MAAAMGVDNDIKNIMGVFDPAQLGQGNISGKALNGQQQQVDLTNFDYYDNLTRSISHVGKICLDLIPKIYDTERVMRIIGDDGKPELLTINQIDSVGRVLNDISVGQYDVVMETGPGYNSKRQEAVDNMLPLLSAAPDLMKVAGDLVFRNMDWPGADIIADRLAAANPMAQIDDKSKIPPQVQMQLAVSQKQIQELTQQLQTQQMLIKQRQDVEQVKQEAETKRTLIKETNRAHEIELREQSDREEMRMRVDGQAHDTVLKTQTQLEIERMKGQIALLLASMDKRALNNASAETTERAI